MKSSYVCDRVDSTLLSNVMRKLHREKCSSSKETGMNVIITKQCLSLAAVRAGALWHNAPHSLNHIAASSCNNVHHVMNCGPVLILLISPSVYFSGTTDNTLLLLHFLTVFLYVFLFFKQSPAVFFLPPLSLITTYR